MRIVKAIILVGILALAIFLPASSPAGSSAPLPSDSEDWLKRSREIMEQAGNLKDQPVWLNNRHENSTKILDAADKITRESRAKAMPPSKSDAGRAAPSKGQAEGDQIFVFFTLGPNPQQDLPRIRRDLQAIASSSPEATVVLRGVPSGSSGMNGLVFVLKEVLKDLVPAPGIILDPVRFQRYGVQSSPTLLLERNGQAVAWARGIVNGAWLREKVAAGEKGDLGVWGQTAAIAEQDFLELIKSKVASVDWEAKKQAAVKRYWTKASEGFLDLPKATKNAVRRFQPAYQATEDVKLPDGRVLVKKGTAFNTLDLMPASFVLIVFNGADPAQVAKAKEITARFAGKKRIKLVATAIPNPSDGWQSYADLQNKVGGPVTMLDRNLAKRFKVEKVPSAVYADGREFVVEEFGMPQGGKN